MDVLRREARRHGPSSLAAIGSCAPLPPRHRCYSVMGWTPRPRVPPWRRTHARCLWTGRSSSNLICFSSCQLRRRWPQIQPCYFKSKLVRDKCLIEADMEFLAQFLPIGTSTSTEETDHTLLMGKNHQFGNPLLTSKKLEPLKSCVLAVLLTLDQFRDLEKSLEFEKPKYDESRSLLRSGPTSSLCINIRAVAQYASGNGQGKAPSDAVDECLRALEDLDSLLLKATRKDPSAFVETTRSKIAVALGALDNLLQAVRSTVMDKGKAIDDAYKTPSDDYYE